MTKRKKIKNAALQTQGDTVKMLLPLAATQFTNKLFDQIFVMRKRYTSTKKYIGQKEFILLCRKVIIALFL